MIPLIPGRLHRKKGAGDTLVFRRIEGKINRVQSLPNLLVYIGPHPRLPHLALLKSETDPNWFHWDQPEMFTALDEMTPESLVGGFRATRPAATKIA